MEFQGIVKQVLPLESGVSKSGNQWSKASVVFDVTTNPQYPKLVKVSNMKKADVFAKNSYFACKSTKLPPLFRSCLAICFAMVYNGFEHQPKRFLIRYIVEKERKPRE